MANYNVWGFGGVRFTYGGASNVTFPYGFGQLSYKAEYNQIKNPNGKIFRKFKGWRRYIDCTLISSADNMYIQVQRLIAMIQQATAANDGIYIYPEYSSNNNNNLYIGGMLLDSEFSLEDIVKREGIQKIKLKFICLYLWQDMPVLTNSGVRTLVNEGDDIFVDESGNTFIAE